MSIIARVAGRIILYRCTRCGAGTGNLHAVLRHSRRECTRMLRDA